jgi:hypothetical protein
MPRVRLLWLLALVLSTSALAAKKPVLVDAPGKLAKVLNKELSRKYAPLPLKGSLGPSPTAKEVRHVTAKVKAIAVIQAQASGKYVTLQVLSGDDGTPLDVITFRPPKKFKALPREAADALFAALAKGQAPSGDAGAPAPAAEAAKAPDEPSKTPDKADTSDKGAGKVAEKRAEPAKAEPEERAPSPSESPTEVSGRTSFAPSPSDLPAVVTGVGFKGFGRSFGWAAGSSDALASYSLPFAGAVAFEGAWYPGAHFTKGFGANLGVFLSGEVGIGLASKQDASRYQTRADRFRFGARVRVPVGEKLLLDGVLGYSTQTFAIAPQAATTGLPRPNIPSVTYNGPRAAVGATFQFNERFGADVLAGFLFVYGKGELASAAYFPNTTGVSVDAGLGVTVKAVEALCVRASFDWTGYFLTIHADPMALFTSTGATDHYFGGTLSLLWIM